MRCLHKSSSAILEISAKLRLFRPTNPYVVLTYLDSSAYTSRIGWQQLQGHLLLSVLMRRIAHTGTIEGHEVESLSFLFPGSPSRRVKDSLIEQTPHVFRETRSV